MPHAVLASIVVVYSIGLIQLTDFRDILQVRRMEFIWAASAFFGVMLIGTLKGILVAIIISLFALAHQAANPRMLCAASQTRNKRVPPALTRTSARRVVPRAATAALRRAAILP